MRTCPRVFDIRFLAACLACVGAVGCASLPRSSYVPGGGDLPADSVARYRQAVASEGQGDWEAALSHLHRLTATHPLQLGIHLRRIDLARRIHGPEAAAALYDPAPPGIPPARAATLARLARLPADDVAGRGSALEQALSVEPGEPFWRLGLADVGLTAFEIVLERAAKESDLGEVQASRRSYEEAARVLEGARQDTETALQLDPKFMEAHLLLGYISARRAELASDVDEADSWRSEAKRQFEQALELDPESFAAHLNFAESLLQLDRYSEAVKYLRRAVRLAPADPVGWNNLGYTLYRVGRTREAVRSYRKALELDPSLARARAALSDGLRRGGDADGARRELEHARNDAGEDRELLAEIAFKLAAIHEHEGRPSEAVREYETHIAMGGRDAAKARSRIRQLFEGTAG